MSTRWKTLIAFAIIYFVWGSSYLAIRIGVAEMPPLVMAAICFTVAGLAMTAWGLTRGERLPSRGQWGSVVLLAALFFLADYGFLFWAEQRVESGVAAVILATIPAFTAVAEIIWLRTQRLTPGLAVALLVGLAGVLVLVDPASGMGGKPVYLLGAAGLIAGALCWSIGSVLTRLLALPSSKVMSAGTQMLAGGLLLALAAGTDGELRQFHAQMVSTGAWLAVLYLIGVGSIMGFTAYSWLLQHHSPTKVGTYAYVNPVVAMAIGTFLGGEVLDLRAVLGSALIIVSVLIITMTKALGAAPPQPVSQTGSGRP